MSNSLKRVRIIRISLNGRWLCLQIMNVDVISINARNGVIQYNHTGNRNIDNTVTSMIDRYIRRFSLEFLENINLDKLRSDIVQGFHQMEEIDLNRSTQGVWKVIFLVPEKHPAPHVSC